MTYEEYTVWEQATRDGTLVFPTTCRAGSAAHDERLRTRMFAERLAQHEIHVLEARSDTT